MLDQETFTVSMCFSKGMWLYYILWKEKTYSPCGIKSLTIYTHVGDGGCHEVNLPRHGYLRKQM